MNHDKYKDWISRDLDGDLSQEEKQELEKHLAGCDECRSYGEDLRNMTQTLSQVPKLELESSIKDRTEKAMKVEKRKSFLHHRWLPYAAALLVVFILVVPLMGRFLGGALQSGEDSATDGEYPGYNGDIDDGGGFAGDDLDTGEESDNGDSKNGGDVTLDSFDPTKIIYSGYIGLYTEDLEETMDAVTTYAEGMGGFIQQSSSDRYQGTQESGGRSGYLVIRIPSADFYTVMDHLEEFGDVINTNQNSTNITQQYQDIQGELDSYLIQQDRLLEYLSQAEDIEDMLAIEAQLTRVRSEINYRTTLIKNWDTQVAYSTIQISLYERSVAVSKVTSPFEDFANRIRDAFVRSINYMLTGISNLIVGLTAILPYLLVLAVIGLIIWALVRRRKK